MKTKAAVLYEMGRPQPYAESLPLVIDEITLEAPGPGEVLVEIAAAGLCHSDLSVVDGSRPRVMPMVLGHEASGIVREVGPAASVIQAVNGLPPAITSSLVGYPSADTVNIVLRVEVLFANPVAMQTLPVPCSTAHAVLLTHVRSKLAIIISASQRSRSLPSPRRSRW